MCFCSSNTQWALLCPCFFIGLWWYLVSHSSSLWVASLMCFCSTSPAHQQQYLLAYDNTWWVILFFSESPCWCAVAVFLLLTSNNIWWALLRSCFFVVGLQWYLVSHYSSLSYLPDVLLQHLSHSPATILSGHFFTPAFSLAYDDTWWVVLPLAESPPD